MRLLPLIAVMGLTMHAGAQLAAAGAYNVVWKTPTKEVEGYFAGAMPLGNGDVQVLTWANVSAGGVSLFLAKHDALHSDHLPYKVALVSLAVSPNPFASGPFFEQSLDLASATVFVLAGGRNATTAAAAFSVWVDAFSNTVYATVSSGPGGSPLSLAVTLTPVRPLGYASYTADWHCRPGVSRADTVVDPLPPAGTFPSLATLAIFHTNHDDDLSAGGSFINDTLATQGIAQLVPLVPDLWAGRRFGTAVDAAPGAVAACGGAPGGALVRTSPTTLASAAPGACFAARVSVLSSQAYADDGAWLKALGAQAAAQPAGGPPRAAHEEYWQEFWHRSWVDINATAAPTTVAQPMGAAEASTSPAQQLPVTGASLWLRAASLAAALPNGSRVAAWADESPSGTDVTQGNATAQPTLVYDALGAGLPAVTFDGTGTFLASAAAGVPASGSTMLAVFRDGGSSGGTDNGPCCSGLIYFGPRSAPAGLSTLTPSSSKAADDDDGNAEPGPPVLAMIDFSGSNAFGHLDIRGRTVHAAVVYAGAGGGSALHIDGCLQATAPTSAAASADGMMVGSRNNEMGRYFLGAVGEIAVFPRALNASELAAMAAYFEAAWPAMPPKASCGHAPPSLGFAVSQAYAVSRYLNAVQSRAVLPSAPPHFALKFNGGSWLNRRPTGNTSFAGSPDERQWGPDEWWQNLRLPYGPMLADGDWREQDVMFDYFDRMVPFLAARTRAYFNTSGIDAGWWMTETATKFGSLTQADWGQCQYTRASGLPPWLGANNYVLLDRYGDGPMAELPLMALDRFLYDGDEVALAARLPWAFAAVDFFAFIFPNRTADGQVVISPTQCLETYWCPYPFDTGECVTNDAPTVATVTRLLQRLLQLPPSLLPPARAPALRALLAAMPPLPRTADGRMLAAAARFNASASHNSESTSLYAVHPTRTFSVGRNATVPGGVDLPVAVATFLADPNINGDGWHQGVMHAPLLGERAQAARLLAARAAGNPLAGYRFPFFSGEEGMADFPSAEYYSNLAAGLQFALLQPGDDDARGDAVLLPGLPCDWGASFRLRAPKNTTVEAVYAAGVLQSLVVQPPERASAVIVAPGCVTAAAGA